MSKRPLVHLSASYLEAQTEYHFTKGSDVTATAFTLAAAALRLREAQLADAKVRASGAHPLSAEWNDSYAAVRRAEEAVNTILDEVSP